MAEKFITGPPVFKNEAEKTQWQKLLYYFHATYRSLSANTVDQIHTLVEEKGEDPEILSVAVGRAITHVGLETLLAVRLPADWPDDTAGDAVHEIIDAVELLVNQKLVDLGAEPSVEIVETMMVRRKTAAAFGN